MEPYNSSSGRREIKDGWEMTSCCSPMIFLNYMHDRLDPIEVCSMHSEEELGVKGSGKALAGREK